MTCYGCNSFLNSIKYDDCEPSKRQNVKIVAEKHIYGTNFDKFKGNINKWYKNKKKTVKNTIKSIKNKSKKRTSKVRPSLFIDKK